MKAIRIVILLVAYFIPVSGICGSLEVSVSGVRNAKGEIMVGVYDTDNTFPKTGSEFKGIVIKSIKDEATVVFKDLPEGTYAVAIIHDENKDGKLTKNFLGIPKEGYGFSNDAKATFGSPSFKEASFAMTKDNQNISIKLKY